MIADQETGGLEQALRVLRRRWWVIALCMIVSGAAALGVSLTRQKQYTATATLLFRDPGFDQLLFGVSLFPATSDPTRVTATDLDLADLPVVAQRTATQLGDITAGEVKAAVQVSELNQADVANVSAIDPSPFRAARLANTYAEQYILVRKQADQAALVGAQREIQLQLATLSAATRNTSVGQSLLNRANQLRTLAALQTGDAELAQSASVPAAASSPRPKRNALLAAVIGLILGSALAFLWDRFDRRLRAPSDVEGAYGLPLIGAIPRSPDFETNPLASPLSYSATETFGLLRTRLRYFNVDRGLQSLLVTSATPGDGKSTIALHLAIAEAAAARTNVLLVEADLRQPTLAKRLNLPRHSGLAEVLSGHASLQDALHEVATLSRRHDSEPGPTFTILPAGAIPPNPAQLIESDAMRALLVDLQSQFGLIILDSPPVLVVPDVIPLMSQVSGVLLVCRVGRTTRDSAKKLRSELSSLDAPTLGVVANGVSSRGDSYYGDRYGYHYGGTYGSQLDPVASPSATT